METTSNDQCEPPFPVLVLGLSFMGRKMWVVDARDGRADFMVLGSGVCRSIYTIVGRSRTMSVFGYWLRTSCSSHSSYQAMT